MSNELLDKIIESFEEGLTLKKLKNLTYQDLNEYAVFLGENLSGALNKHIITNPSEFIEEILNDRLRENHRLITNKGILVQNNLNKKAKIGLVAQIPEINQSRIDGLVGRLVNDDFEKSKWLLGSPIVNFSQAVVDDLVKKNVYFHYKAGMDPKIIRKEVGNCCKWCKSLVGTYNYPQVPNDVYKRHENCRCTVEYISRKGIVQNVHNKTINYNLKDLK